VKLEGSCRCGAVRFSVEAQSPAPYMHCYCSICRKSAGGGGYAINLGAWAETLTVEGRDHIAEWRAPLDDPKHEGRTKQGSSRRSFCRHCGSALWAFDPQWPELLHPFASAIDTPLPTPPERVHIMLAYKAPWVTVPSGPQDRHFDHYPDESLESWHRRHGLYDEPVKA